MRSGSKDSWGIAHEIVGIRVSVTRRVSIWSLSWWFDRKGMLRPARIDMHSAFPRDESSHLAAGFCDLLPLEETRLVHVWQWLRHRHPV